MKYWIVKYIMILSFFHLFFYKVQAQSISNPLETYNVRLEFDGEDFEKTIALKITPENRYLQMNVKGKIRGGKASAILYTQRGRRVCGLGLDARSGRYSKGTMGEVLEVRSGIYMLKIRNKKGRGYLNIDFSQH